MNEDFKPTVVDLAPDHAIPRPGIGAWWRGLFGRHAGAWSATRALLGRHAMFRRAPGLLNGHPGCLVVFELDDMAELTSLYGNACALHAAAELGRLLWCVAGRDGLVARTGPVQFALLMPGRDEQAAMAALKEVLGWPCRVEMDLGGDEVVLLPGVRIEACDADTDLPALLSRASALLSCQREREALRQQWLRRSRERWSRPMAL